MILINTMLACICIYNRIRQWYETENLVPTPRRAQHEEQIDLEIVQPTLISKKHKVPQARGDPMLRLTENRERMIRRASGKASFVRAVENGHVCGSNESVMVGNGPWFYAEKLRTKEISKIRDYRQLLTIIS